MFTPIKEEILMLETVLQSLIQIRAEDREDCKNNSSYIEYTGRIIGLEEALNQVRETAIHVDEHIAYILENTVDGNYATKLGILTDENRVLNDKIYLLEKEDKIKNRLNKDNKTFGSKMIDALNSVEENLEL